LEAYASFPSLVLDNHSYHPPLDLAGVTITVRRVLLRGGAFFFGRQVTNPPLGKALWIMGKEEPEATPMPTVAALAIIAMQKEMGLAQRLRQP
jgi:hypothetical protein